MEHQLTPTQGLFLCCLFVFGPLYGFWAAYRAMDSKLGTMPSFLFAAYCAYAGWFASGIMAMILHPNYPYLGPREIFAALYALPGFITGYGGIRLLDALHRKHRLQMDYRSSSKESPA